MRRFNGGRSSVTPFAVHGIALFCLLATFTLVFPQAVKGASWENGGVILDSPGNDTTAQVLAIGESRGSSPAQPDTSAATPERTMRGYGPRFRGLLTLGGGYGIAGGDWYEGFTSGVAFDLGARFAVSDYVYVGFSYRYQKLGVESYLENLEIFDGVDFVSVEVDWDVHVSETFFIVGFMTDPLTDSTPLGYLEVGIGAMNHVIEATASTQDLGSVPVNDDEMEYGLLVGGGGIFPFSKTVGVNVDGIMRTVRAGGGDGYESSLGVIFGVRAGIAFLLGGD